MITTLLGVHQFIPGWLTLALFQGHMCVRIIICTFKKEKKKRFSSLVVKILYGSTEKHARKSLWVQVQQSLDTGTCRLHLQLSQHQVMHKDPANTMLELVCAS